MLRRIRNALWLLVTGVALGGAGTWWLGDDIRALAERVVGKVERTVTQWQPAPKPGATWSLAGGLTLTPHAEGLDYPSRIARAPASSSSELLYYVGELPGRIRAVKPDGSVSTVAEDLLNFTWSEIRELGLMGLAVDPDDSRLYATFAYWDADAGVYRNRVDALELTPDGLGVRERVPLLDMRDEATVASYCVQFVEVGPDGLLYVGVGKGANPADAQSLERFAGKILRLTRDGRAAPDNPFYDPAAPDAPRSYVYALGFRNPFDLGFDPEVASTAVVSDVGPGLDRIVRLERGRNYCFGRGDGDSAMRCNALYTWGPGGGYAPTGVVITNGPPFAPDDERSLFVGIFGAVHTPGAGEGKRIERFAFDPEGVLRSGARQIVAYQGLFYSSVTDVVQLDRDLYFADIFGDGERPHRNAGRIYRISARATDNAGGPDAAPDPEAGLSPYARGARLFQSNGCFACHARAAADGEREGPMLGPDLGKELTARLDSDAYQATLQSLATRGGTYFVERRELYAELLSLSGVDRTRTWLRAHIRDPRFDNPESKMPGFATLSDAELDALATYLLAD